MNNTTNALRRNALLYSGLVFLLTLISVVWRIINLFFFFDADIGYDASHAFSPVFAAIVMASSVIVFLVISVFLFRKAEFDYPHHTPIVLRIAAGIAAIGFLFRAVYAYANHSENDSFAFLALLTGVAGSCYFIFAAFRCQKESFRILTGFCVILHLVLALATSYFNVFIPMNAPDKLIFQLGCLAGMLFLINELRAWISHPRPVWYRFSAGCAVFLTASASIPSIIAYHTGRLTDTVFMAGYYLLLGLCFYIAVRLVTVSLHSESPVKEEQTEQSASTLHTDAAESPADRTSEKPEQETEEPFSSPEEINIPDAEEGSAPESSEQAPSEEES